MRIGPLFVDERVEKAVLECIAEHGVDQVDVGVVARHLGRARSTLYLQHGDWQTLLLFTHERALEGINTLFPSASGETRAEFEGWWSALNEFLRGPLGVGFLRLRTRLQLKDSLEVRELAQLPAYLRWVGARVSSLVPTPLAVARTVWLVALSAAVHPAAMVDLRELAWSLIGSQPRRKIELDDTRIEALGPLL